LVAEEDTGNPEVLDTHPFIREYFTRELRAELADFWRDGNRLLFEHCKSTVPDRPETTDQMGWLYQAVAHGCRAGRHAEAAAIYRDRIMRGDESYSTRRLGLYAADLAGLSHFFDQPWEKPSALLGPEDAAYLVRTAGFRLRGLARLDEAAEALRRAFLSYKAEKNPLEASRVGRNLCETLTLMGDLAEARTVGDESIILADVTQDLHQKIAERAAVAVTYHYLGRVDNAEALFRRAEALQAELTPRYPKLYALRGYHYSVFMLEQGKSEEVVRRGEETLGWVERKQVEGYGPVDLPLEHLALAMAKLQRGAGHTRRDERIAASKPHFEVALAGLRRAGRSDFLPLGLLGRSLFLREVAEDASNPDERAAHLARAEEYLDEVEQICTKVQMSVYLLDCHLERARVQLAKGGGGAESAAVSLQTAKGILNSCPYFRRSGQLAELERQAGGPAATFSARHEHAE
jgi:tetratricopeptide (TPR) repeat protein